MTQRSAGQNERQIANNRLKNVRRNRAVASANFTNGQSFGSTPWKH